MTGQEIRNGLKRRGLQPLLVSSDCLLRRLDKGRRENSPPLQRASTLRDDDERPHLIIVLVPQKRRMTLPSESVSHNWLYFVVVVAVDKWEAAFCFPLIHSLFS